MFRRLESYSGGKFTKGKPLSQAQKNMMIEAKKKATLEKKLLVETGQASDMKEATKLRKKMLKDNSKKYEDLTEKGNVLLDDLASYTKKDKEIMQLIKDDRMNYLDSLREHKGLSLKDFLRIYKDPTMLKSFGIAAPEKKAKMDQKKQALEDMLILKEYRMKMKKINPEGYGLKKRVPKGGALIYPTNLNHDVGSGGGRGVSAYHKSHMKEFKKVPLEVVRELHRRAGFKNSHLKKHAAIASDLMAGGYFWDDIWQGLKTVASDLWSGLKTVGTETWEQAIKPATAEIWNKGIAPQLPALGKELKDATVTAYKAKVGLGIRKKRVPKTHRLTYKF